MSSSKSIPQSLYKQLKMASLHCDFVQLFKDLSYSTSTKYLEWAESKSSVKNPNSGYYLIISLCVAYHKYIKLVQELEDDYEKNGEYTIHPSYLHQFSRELYDSIKGKLIKYFQDIDTSGCGFTDGFNEYSEDINKVTWDHFNIPQLVFCFMINEFIIEDVKYSFEAFAKLWYELAKTHGVLKTQNKDLSCKDKPVMVNQRFDTRYIDEGIEVMDLTYNKINSRSSFPKFLLGSKANRKYTWMPWGRAGSGSWYGLWNEEGYMIGNWGE